MESVREAKVILIFHIVCTLMELFKTGVGSRSYPEASFFRLGPMPLLSGFVYASVGSYRARVARILNVRYTRCPYVFITVTLAFLTYALDFARDDNLKKSRFLPPVELLILAQRRLLQRTQR
jgi:uncharacterized membrane protein YoaT (DUF817 family)